MRNRIVGILFVLAVASSAFSFMKGKPPGAKFAPNQTQEQVAAQQAHQATMGEVNRVDYSGASVDSPTGSNDSDASEAVSSVENTRDSQTSDIHKAEDALVKMNDLNKMPQTSIPWTLIIAGLGTAGAVFGFRAYANRAVPDMPTVVTTKATPVESKKFTW